MSRARRPDPDAVEALRKTLRGLIALAYRLGVDPAVLFEEERCHDRAAPLHQRAGRRERNIFVLPLNFV
jgi:hypothetical protein